MKLSIVFTKQFKKDFPKIESRQKRLQKFIKIISSLSRGVSIESKFHEGEYNDFRECHIEPDFLLIYKIENDCLILVRCGSHSDLFK